MRKRYKRFIKYCIYGLIGGIMEILLFYMLYELIGINYIISNIVSFFTSVITLYYLNKKYVYNTIFISSKQKRNKFLMFIITRTFSLIIDTIILSICLKVLFVPSIISKIIAASSTAVINFLVGESIFK